MVDSELSNEEIDSLLKDLDESAPDKEAADGDLSGDFAEGMDSASDAGGGVDMSGMENDTSAAANFTQSDKQVKKIKFSDLSADGEDLVPSNMKMLLDVPMDITVELGRTVRKIKDILSLNVGAVIELNKLSGEPVELLVNGKIIALAEVVVIDEYFGVRIIEIVDPENRIKFE